MEHNFNPPNQGVYRLLSWNVAGRARRLPDQIDAILAVRPDTIALQEVTLGTAPVFHAFFRSSGYPYTIDSFQISTSREQLKGPRRYAQLLASRFPLTPLDPANFDIPWPGRELSAILPRLRSVSQMDQPG
jgi:hypothetical protein